MYYADDSGRPTRIDDEGIFASRTMLRLNIGFGPSQLYEEAPNINSCFARLQSMSMRGALANYGLSWDHCAKRRNATGRGVLSFQNLSVGYDLLTRGGLFSMRVTRIPISLYGPGPESGAVFFSADALSLRRNRRSCPLKSLCERWVL